MNLEDKVDFAIRNLMCVDDISLSREDIFNIARYAIENKIVNVTGTIVGNICLDYLDLQKDVEISEIIFNDKD